MPKTADELQPILDAGDVEGCVAFFADASESERQALAKSAEAWLKKLVRDRFQETAPGRFERNPLLPVAEVAVLAACPLSTIKKFGWRVRPDEQILPRVLADRKPKWLDDYAESLLDRDHPSWRTVRAMMKAGLCRKPTHDNYVLGMFHRAGVGHDTNGDILQALLNEPDLLDDVWRLFEIEGGGEYSLAAHDKFSRKPSYRWDHSLVELSKQGKLPRQRLLDASLDALERGFAQFRVGWFSAFYELLEPTVEERLARLEQYLRLLASPIPPTVSFAFAAITVIDQQQPLPAEQLVEHLRPLMLARHKGTVKSALKLLDTVARREPARASDTARVAVEALAHEASDVQAAAIKLIETHGAISDRELTDAVSRAQDLVAASLRQRLHAWLAPAGDAIDKKTTTPRARAKSAKPSAQSPPMAPGQPAVSGADLKSFEKRASRLPEPLRKMAGVDRALAALKDGAIDLTACEFDGMEIPRLDPAKAVQPIESLDELIDAALAVIENTEDYDEHERVLDGISRLCDQRPADFEQRSGPLLKRVHQLLSRGYHVPFVGEGPLADLLGVILAWLCGDYGTYKATKSHGERAIEYSLADVSRTAYVPKWQTIDDAFAARGKAVAERVVKQQAAPLLSAPTHAGGWIAPQSLVARVRLLNGAPDAGDFEHALALLRLAPDGRAEARSSLEGFKGEFVAALRYALGDGRTRIGETAWLWAAAARARSPWCDDAKVIRRHPNLGPDTAEAARPAFKTGKIKAHNPLSIPLSPALPSKIDLRLLSMLIWRRPDESGSFERASAPEIRQRYSLWPLALESVFARGAIAFAENLDWWEARWANRTYLEPLLDADVPLRPMALLLLVLGLAAKDPGEHGLATDAAITAIGDGRLDGAKLGAIMAELLPTGLIKAARWAKTLGDVARASPLHAEVIREAIARSLRGTPKSYPKDLHALVELLKELVAETHAAVDEEARQFLSQISGSSKLAKAAKTILAFDAHADPQRTAVLQSDIVEQRLARAERWATINSTVQSK